MDSGNNNYIKAKGLKNNIYEFKNKEEKDKHIEKSLEILL